MHGRDPEGLGPGADRAPRSTSAERIEKQLRRYMSPAEGPPRGPADLGGLVLAEADAAYTVFAVAPDDDEAAGDNPPIVAETSVDIPDATVSDAVMLLDLRNTPALLFRNSGTGGFNWFYRRQDGTIGWVEPRID